MTEKEREKLGIDKYLVPPIDLKAVTKLLCKELKKSLEKKGYHVEKDELYYEKMEGHDDFRHVLFFGLNANIESFELSNAENITKAWKDNDLSILKTAKEDKEFKKFTKVVKKHLKEEGRYEEPEPKEEREI